MFKYSTTLQTCRYTTLWNINAKRHHSEICIAINDKSQGSIAKNLRCDELLYYTFIIHSPGERIFKIGVLSTYYRQKLLLSVAMWTGRLMWVNYQEISNCCKPVLTYWLTGWRRQRLTDCWSCTAFCHDSFSLSRQLYTVGHGKFLYGQCKQLFVSELNNA